MTNAEVIKSTIEFVKNELLNAEAGHDWWHVLRVWNSAKTLAEEEHADIFVVELAALLHDIADSKFNEGDEEIGPRKAAEFLRSLDVEEPIVIHVEQIIRNMSFKSSLSGVSFRSKEMKVVQDADRLDAMGAIGIARAFSFGGFKAREFYDPAVEPNLHLSKEEYKKSAAPTINHFYEKLLLLKDLMNTSSGKRLSEDRHRFMELYLDQFYAEWDGLK